MRVHWWAHWCHLANTIELVLPSAHLSPQPKSANQSVQPFLHSLWQSVIGHCPGMFFPLIIAPLHGDVRPIKYMLPWAHPSPQPKRHLDWFSPFLHRPRQSVTILYNGLPLSPVKITPSHGDLDLYLIHGSLGPPESSTQTASGLVGRFCRAH